MDCILFKCAGQFLEEKMFALQINHQSSKVLATCMIHDLQQNSEIQLHYAGFPMQINRLSITVD